MLPSLALSIVGSPTPDRSRLQELQGRLGILPREGAGDGRMDWIRKTFGEAVAANVQAVLALQSMTMAQAGSVIVPMLRMAARQDPGTGPWRDPQQWPSLSDVGLLVESTGFRLDRATAAELLDALAQMQIRLDRELLAVLEPQNIELDGLDPGFRAFLGWVRRRIALRDVDGPWPDLRWLYDGAAGLGLTGVQLAQMGVGALSARSAAWHGQEDILSFQPEVWAAWQARVDTAIAQGWVPPPGDVIRSWPSGFSLQDISLASARSPSRTLELLQGESAIMAHCVGQGSNGSGYAQACASGRSRIWSLRTPQGYPVLTFEATLRNPDFGPVSLANVKTFGQIYGPRNTPVNPAHAVYLVDLLLSQEASGVKLPESISKLLATLVEPHMTSWDLALSNPMLALAAALRMRDRLKQDPDLARTLRQAVSPPALALRFALEVDGRPDDMTREWASLSPSTALDYAKKVDQGGHPVTRAGATRDPRDVEIALSYWLDVDRGAPSPEALGLVVRDGHRGRIDRAFEALDKWLLEAADPEAAAATMMRAVDEANLAWPDLGLVWSRFCSSTHPSVREALLLRVARHPMAIVRAVELHLDRGTPGVDVLPAELLEVVASSPIAAALVLRTAAMATRARTTSRGHLPLPPLAVERLVPVAFSTRLSIAILLTATVEWQGQSRRSWGSGYCRIDELLRMIFPLLTEEDPGRRPRRAAATEVEVLRAEQMLRALVEAPWGGVIKEEEDAIPLFSGEKEGVFGLTGLLNSLRVLGETRKVRVAERRRVTLTADPDRLAGVRCWGTGPYQGVEIPPLGVGSTIELSSRPDQVDHALSLTRAGWLETRHGEEVVWLPEEILERGQMGMQAEIWVTVERVGLDADLVTAMLEPLLAALPAPQQVRDDRVTIVGATSEAWLGLASALGEVLVGWPEVARDLVPLPWLALVPAALQKDAPPAVLAALATPAGRKGLSAPRDRFGSLEPRHVDLVLRALRQADRTTTVPWPQATGRVPRIPRDVESLVGSMGQAGRADQSVSFAELPEGILAYPPVFRWKARSSEIWSSVQWRERTWGKETVHDSPLSDLEARVVDHVLEGVARGLRFSPDPRLRAAAPLLRTARGTPSVLDDPSLRSLRPILSHLIAWATRDRANPNEQGFQDVSGLRVTELWPPAWSDASGGAFPPLPGWAPPPSWWSSTALAGPGRQENTRPSFPTLYLGQSGISSYFPGFVSPPSVAEALSGAFPSSTARSLAGGALGGRSEWRPEVPPVFLGGDGFLGSRERAVAFARRAKVSTQDLLRGTTAQRHVQLLWLASTPEDAEAHAKTMIVWRVETAYLPVLGMVPSLSESGQVGYTLFLSGSMPVTHTSCPRFLYRY